MAGGLGRPRLVDLACFPEGAWRRLIQVPEPAFAPPCDFDL